MHWLSIILLPLLHISKRKG
ncbi:hypothetical protein FKG96_20345 [Olivibacter sp. LS-1]|nr:hypothetical protein FKG96_20345 [Olivibacter sp. LS-1]